MSGPYNGLIKGQDAIIIWIARADANLGVPAYKAFGGRIVSMSNRGDDFGAFYVDLDCHGHAYELDIPPALLQARYAATNGRTIIEEALALCSYVAKHPTASMWFDNAGSTGSTDDQIDSDHDAVYDEELALAVIQEILEKAINPEATQGFDCYETPGGVLVGHLRGSADFVSPIDGIYPQSYKKGVDVHRVRNKIKVYGATGKKDPLLGDEYTESTDDWTSDGTLDITSITKKMGTYSVKADRTAVMVWAERALPNVIMTDYRCGYKRVHVWLMPFPTVGDDSYLYIFLCAPDYANSFRYTSGIIKKGVWTEFDLPIGRDSAIWETASGTPDWNDIESIRFVMEPVGGSQPMTLYMDNLFFAEARFSGVATDFDSQQAYGVRCSKPIVDDSLLSDAECLARAESIKAVLKDPVVTLSEVNVDGDHRYNPGDLQRVIVANDDLDESFRIIEASPIVRKSQWDTLLTLSNEPQYIDYVFKLITENAKLLDRRI
jgi:hypothetical protein